MKNVWNGCYLRYDGQLVYVVDTIKNIDTGEQMVVCRYNAPKTQHHYVIGKESFLETVDAAGKRIPKYRRLSPSRALSEEEAERAYQQSGVYPPERAVRRRKSSRNFSDDTYLSYAKDMCESYLRDVRMAREGALKGAEEECERARENVQFLERCLAGELNGFAEYFRERFVEGKSIRTYAAEHGINRGSVDYMQKKFFAALAKYLQEHSAADSEETCSDSIARRTQEY